MSVHQARIFFPVSLVPGALLGMLLALPRCAETEAPPPVNAGSTSGSTSMAVAASTDAVATATPTSSGTSVGAVSAVTESVVSGTATTAAPSGSTDGVTATATAVASVGGSLATGTNASTTSVGGAAGTSTLSSVSSAMTGAGGTGMLGGAFVLSSSELEDGAAFLDKHTCAMSGFDNDESPPLAWSGAPVATQSFALVFLDVTLTDMGDTNGYHWVMWDIPASVSELPAHLPSGAELTTPVSAKQYNPLSPSYLGPCPNFGGAGETHTYEFTLYAMPDAETAALAALSNVQTLEAAIQAVALGSATLSGTSDASPP